MFKIVFTKSSKGSKTKIKKYRWKRFLSEFIAFFYNKIDHRIRKGPILLLFFVSIILQLSIIGFTMAINYANGKPMVVKDLIAFFLLTILFSINLFSIVRFKKMATPTSFNMGSSFGSVSNLIPKTKTTSRSPSTPKLGKGVIPNKKVINGDNR